MCVNAKRCKKKRRLSAFFGQQHKEETAETSMANNEAESKDDQSSVPKSKLSKWNFQQSWLEMYKWLKFDLPKGMFSLLCQKSKKQDPFTVGCAKYRTWTLVHNTRYIRIKKYIVKKKKWPPKKQSVPLKIVDWDTLHPKLQILDQTLSTAYN